MKIKLLKPLTLLFLLYVCTAGNAAISKEIASYFGNSHEEDELALPIWLTLATLFFSAMNALPFTLAMVDPNARAEITVEEEQPAQEETATATPHCNRIKSLGRPIIISVPPALLAMAGSLGLFNAKIDTDLGQLILACIAGIAAAWGYNRLLSTDVDAKDRCIDLYRRLPANKKCSKSLVAASVILGTLSENYLTIDIFLKTAGKMNSIIKMALIAVIVLLSTGFVCNTEIRSILLQEFNQTAHAGQRSLTGYLMIMPAIISGLFASVGMAKIAKLILPELSLAERAIVFAVAVVLTIIPNGKGYYHTTLPATENAVKQAARAYRNYKATFFAKNNLEAVNLLKSEQTSTAQEYSGANTNIITTVPNRLA